MAGIVITKVMRHQGDLVVMDKGGITLGKIVDTFIAEALTRCDEIQTIKIELEPSEWGMLQKQRARRGKATKTRRRDKKSAK